MPITAEDPQFLNVKVDILEATLYETINRLETLEKEWHNLRVLTGFEGLYSAEDVIDYFRSLNARIKISPNL